MRFVRLAILSLFAIALTLTTTGCGAVKDFLDSTSFEWHQAAPNAPELIKSPLGATMAKYGYTPVAQYRKDHKAIGYVYGICPDGNLTKCTDEMYDTVTADKPLVRVDLNGQIVDITGPNFSDRDSRNFQLTLPKGGYRDLVKMNETQRVQVLGLMQAALKKFDRHSDAKQEILLPPVGQVVVSVSSIRR